MANAYITLTTFKASSGLDIAGTAYDARLRALIENVSREIDRYTDRIFYYTIETREFSGRGVGTLRVPDLIAIPGSGLKEDDNKDGTFEVVWSATDFLYAPYNANPTATFGTFGPYTKLEVNTRTDGTQDTFVKGQRNYQVTGTWGYSKAIYNTGEKASGTWTAAGTLLVLQGSTTLSVGQTIVVDDEIMYIKATTLAGTITVDRAVNGSTGATHSLSNVNELLFPGPIQEAVLIQTARLWQRRNSGFASQVGMPETGQFVVFRGGLDADVKTLLQGYTKIVAG